MIDYVFSDNCSEIIQPKSKIAMKHTLLPFVALFMVSLISCQKKQYASFQKSYQPEYEHASKKSIVHNATTEPTTAASATAEEIALSLPSNPTETFSANNSAAIAVEKLEASEVETVIPQTSVKKKISLKQKIQGVRQIKNLSKQLKHSSSTKPLSSSADTLAIVSLIAGVLGIVLLFLTGWVGLLLGLLALILGVISLPKTSKRGLALAGIILGSLVLLIGLLVVIFIASIITKAI